VDKLNAFEMWVWRRIEKVSWEDKKTNEEVLAAVGEDRCFVQAMVKREKNWIGYVVPGNSLLKLVKNGREETKREAKDGHD